MTLPKLSSATTTDSAAAFHPSGGGTCMSASWAGLEKSKGGGSSWSSPPSSGNSDLYFPKMSGSNGFSSSGSGNTTDMSGLRTLNEKKSTFGAITSRSINAYYKHLERFNMERSRSLVSLNRSVRSGRPAILKPLKLWRGGSEGKDRMIWIYGNPWSSTDPKYLRTGSGQMTRINDDRPNTRDLHQVGGGGVENISLISSRTNSRKRIGLPRSQSEGGQSRRVGWASDPQSPASVNPPKPAPRGASFSGRKPLAKLKPRTSRRVEPLPKRNDGKSSIDRAAVDQAAQPTQDPSAKLSLQDNSDEHPTLSEDNDESVIISSVPKKKSRPRQAKKKKLKENAVDVLLLDDSSVLPVESLDNGETLEAEIFDNQDKPVQVDAADNRGNDIVPYEIKREENEANEVSDSMLVENEYSANDVENTENGIEDGFEANNDHSTEGMTEHDDSKNSNSVESSITVEDDDQGNSSRNEVEGSREDILAKDEDTVARVKEEQANLVDDTLASEEGTHATEDDETSKDEHDNFNDGVQDDSDSVKGVDSTEQDKDHEDPPIEFEKSDEEEYKFSEEEKENFAIENETEHVDSTNEDKDSSSQHEQENDVDEEDEKSETGDDIKNETDESDSSETEKGRSEEGNTNSHQDDEQAEYKTSTDLDESEERADDVVNETTDDQREDGSDNQEDSDSSRSDNFFTDQDEDDLQISDVSTTEEADIQNPELLEHFGEKVTDNVADEEEVQSGAEDPGPTDDQSESPAQLDDENGQETARLERLTSIDRNIQVDTAGLGNPVLLPTTTLDATVNDIITRIRSKASLEEHSSHNQQQQQQHHQQHNNKYDFAAFNWKPNPKFFQFGEQASAAAVNEVMNGEVFTFAPVSAPSTVDRRRQTGIRNLKAKSVGRLKPKSRSNLIYKS